MRAVKSNLWIFNGTGNKTVSYYFEIETYFYEFKKKLAMMKWISEWLSKSHFN